MTKISEAWAWMWECGPPAKQQRVIAAARAFVKGTESVEWCELCDALRALDAGERERLVEIARSARGIHSDKKVENQPDIHACECGYIHVASPDGSWPNPPSSVTTATHPFFANDDPPPVLHTTYGSDTGDQSLSRDEALEFLEEEEVEKGQVGIERVAQCYIFTAASS